MSSKKKYIVMILILIIPAIYVTCCNVKPRPKIDDDAGFEERLSFYKLFQGKPAELIPAANVEVLELSSTLFTDYAEKQRLIKLPQGKKMKLTGNGLPDFPEGTLIAKTFYYPLGPGGKLQIMETRLLLLEGGKWNVAVYKWNKEQTEAFLITDGDVVPVKRLDSNGKMMAIGYHIPANQECVSCHHSNDTILPIGPKARNLNVEVVREQSRINQLQYLIDKGLMSAEKLDKIEKLPPYKDTKASIHERARGYLEINCAHCHQQGGFAGRTTLNLDYGSMLDKTGIRLHRNNILMRMSEMGDFHMPKLGTTMIDTAGLQLIKDYLETLD